MHLAQGGALCNDENDMSNDFFTMVNLGTFTSRLKGPGMRWDKVPAEALLHKGRDGRTYHETSCVNDEIDFQVTWIGTIPVCELVQLASSHDITKNELDPTIL
jgi:hypothetical protein